MQIVKILFTLIIQHEKCHSKMSKKQAAELSEYCGVSSSPTGKFCKFFCSRLKKFSFLKFFFHEYYQSMCQTVLIQIGHGIMSGLICVQTVCKLSADDTCR